MRKRLFIAIVILLVIIPLVVSMVLLTLNKNSSPNADKAGSQVVSTDTNAKIRKKLSSGSTGNQNISIIKSTELLKQGDYRVIEVIVNQNGVKSNGVHLFTVLRGEEVLIKPTDEWDPILEDENLPDIIRDELRNHLVQGNPGGEDL